MGWHLFYTVLYDFSEHRNTNKDLKNSINFMIDSPLSFLEEFREEISIAKILCGRASSSVEEKETIDILEKCWNKIKMYIQK